MPESSSQDLVAASPIDFDRGERFAHLLLETQPRLFGFVLSLVHDRQAAMDVTQEVGVLLWRKFDEFEAGTDFGAWALKVARYKTMEWRRLQTRLPIRLDDETLERLADEVESMSQHQAARLSALEACLDRLPSGQRRILDERYRDKDAVIDIAARWNRSRIAIHQQLKKAHQALRHCIRKQLNQEGLSP